MRVINQEALIAEKSISVITKEFVIKNTSSDYYGEYYQDIAVDGYMPIAVGYRSSNADINVYSCCLRGENQVFVGITNVNLTNLSPGVTVTVTVTYMRTESRVSASWDEMADAYREGVASV